MTDTDTISKAIESIITSNGYYRNKWICEPYAIHDVQKKSNFLRNAYSIAIERMGVVVPGASMTTWKDCCQAAIDRVGATGYSVVTADTVMRWNREFRVEEKFPHPNPYIANGLAQKKTPILFELFPTASVDVSEYIINHQDHFAVEMLVEHFNETMLPALHEEAKKLEDESEEMQLTQKLMEDNPKYTTVYRWVKYLGFKVEKAKKCYYVDGHEFPEQKKARVDMSKMYLMDIEPRCNRWIQMTLEQFHELQSSLPEDDKIIHKGYEYDEDDVRMIEFHVDNHEQLQQLASEKYPDYGGMKSVRALPGCKTAIIFGQDEAIFSENCSMPYQWVDPNGKRVMLPKSNGYSVMVSSFQSRETGLVVDFTEDQLDEVNKKCRTGQHYPEEVHEAAIQINGTTLKPKLESSPFTVFFPFGGGNYWTGNHMTLQTHDVMDCLEVLFPSEEYDDWYFLFDHSSGHAKKRTDGLDVTDMNVDWGGSKGMNMRKTKIEQNDGYLGPYHDPDDPWMVKVGQTLLHVYPKDGDGELGEDEYVPPSPVNLTTEQREQYKNDTTIDIPIEKQSERPKRKKELIPELLLTPIGVELGKNQLEKMRVPELQVKAIAAGIPVMITPTARTKNGWSGRGIGMLAAAYARGWVDKTRLKSYQQMKYDGW